MSLWWKRTGKLRCPVHPRSQIILGFNARWLHKRPSLHGSSIHVSRLRVRFRQHLVLSVLFEAYDERSLPRPDTHVAVDHEADAAEHLPLGHPFPPQENGTYALAQHLVVRHVRSLSAPCMLAKMTAAASQSQRLRAPRLAWRFLPTNAGALSATLLRSRMPYSTMVYNAVAAMSLRCRLGGEAMNQSEPEKKTGSEIRS